MLKLQRVSIHRERDIAIRLRDRDAFFNKNLIRSIAIALFLHLVGFVLINVAPQKVMILSAHRPVVAEADMGGYQGSGSVTTLQIDEHGLLPRYILEPEAAIPSLPEMPRSNVTIRTDHKKEMALPEEHFTQVETISYVSPLKTLPFTRFGSPIKVRIAGVLASRKVIAKKLQGLSQEAKKMNMSGHHTVKIDVRVDDKTGEVFWTALKKVSEVDKLNEFAVEIAKNLSFNRMHQTFVTQGEIEVFFDFPEPEESTEISAYP